MRSRSDEDPEANQMYTMMLIINITISIMQIITTAIININCYFIDYY